ncbi:MAG: helix-turn-helix transcriptional regulator [Prevotella sp.]|nr:helix-turn-helix transcriptional regulator [Prevotella sp.]
MKQFRPIENQEYLSFNDEDIVIIDKIQNMPENSAYYSDYVVLMICTSGKAQITYDGQVFVVHQGEVFLSVPGSVFSDYMLSPSFDCKVLAIKPSEVSASHEMRRQILNSLLYIKIHPVAKLSETDYATVFDYYNLICSRLRGTRGRYFNGEIRVLLNAFLFGVVGIMDRDMEVSDRATTVHGDEIVEKFLVMVNENCGHNRLVEYYASKLNITAKYLSTLVRSSLNRTPTDVIQAVTIKEIERRLRYSDASIKEISNEMNFPNTSFFGKYFKLHTGMTPNTFRKKYHQ